MFGNETNMIRKVEYLAKGERFFTVVQVERLSKACCMLDGVVYPDVRNDLEPYDFATHIFELPVSVLEKEGGFEVKLDFWTSPTAFFSGEKSVATLVCPVKYDPAGIVDLQTAITRADRGLVLEGEENSVREDGFEYKTELYHSSQGEPIRVYTLVADMKRCRFVAGTPDGKTVFDGSTQTVMGEAQAAEARGERVLAAFNADFYDMFNTQRPSGLCVTRGIAVANPNSKRPYFGLTKEGKTVISTPGQIPAEELSEAVSGMQLLVVDGKINDTAPLEPFGEVAHPRTAVGIRENGDAVFVVVDGRRPEWSNGASLTELAGLMLERGTVTALNLDGGGSSTFIVKQNQELRMLNHPADKFKPQEALIRPIFDSIILVSG